MVGIRESAFCRTTPSRAARHNTPHNIFGRRDSSRDAPDTAATRPKTPFYDRDTHPSGFPHCKHGFFWCSGSTPTWDTPTRHKPQSQGFPWCWQDNDSCHSACRPHQTKSGLPHRHLSVQGDLHHRSYLPKRPPHNGQ